MAGGRPRLGERALTKRERDQRSRQKRIIQQTTLVEALAAIKHPATCGTLREARMIASATLEALAGEGIPSVREGWEREQKLMWVDVEEWRKFAEWRALLPLEQ
jgi:hypothetical protein